MNTEYCAASYDDAENFQKMIDPTWWGAALEYADENEDEITERAEEYAAIRLEVEQGPISDKDILASDRRLVTVGVGRARDPVRLSEMIKGVSGAQRFLGYLTKDHDDYIVECAENWEPMEGKPHDAIKAALEELAAGISDALLKFENNEGRPYWFIVDRESELSLGDAEKYEQLAAQIDLTGRLQRHPIDASLWLDHDSRQELDDAQALRTYDIWQAASQVGLAAPAKPKGWRL